MNICKECQKAFQITQDDRIFYENVSPIFGGKKYLIPEPKCCPDCRQQRRTSLCNEFFLYPGQCGLCNERTLTEHPPHANQPIYCRSCWHGDDWDPLDYGRDFDFSRPFFEQIYELKRTVPSLALISDGTNINSDYIHYAGSSKNCYLIMHADFCEDCYYGYGFKKNIRCVDGFYNLHSELCYDCVDVHTCYDLISCQDCVNCSSGAFLRDCIGCKHCFLCTGLRNKEYCFENKQLSKEEYEQKISEIDLRSFQQYQNYAKKRKELEKNHLFKEFHGRNLQNCFGDYLINCKDAKFCFNCEDVESAKYCYQVVLGAKNIYDIYQYGTRLQESYEGCIVGADSHHLLFTMDGHMASSDLIYCWYMESSKNCFGCVNMHHKSYCIFNKQYSKETYEELVPKIIKHMIKTGEWGEFFPSSISLFGYNKTTAQMYYPLTKEEALSKNWNWDDYEVPSPDVAKIIPANKLPDNIQDIPDDILNWAIKCEITEKPFKITSQELTFYRKQNLPIPRRSPRQRHLDRFSQRNPRTFWKRQCEKCQKEIQTTWSPERPEKILCEDCYLKEVY